MKPDTKKILAAASGGIAAAGAYGGINYMFRDFMVDSRPTALVLKQLGLATAIGFAGWRVSKAGWVSPEFAYGAISFASVMALIHISVRTVIAVDGLPPSGIRGAFARGTRGTFAR